MINTGTWLIKAAAMAVARFSAHWHGNFETDIRSFQRSSRRKLHMLSLGEEDRTAPSIAGFLSHRWKQITDDHGWFDSTWLIHTNTIWILHIYIYIYIYVYIYICGIASDIFFCLACPASCAFVKIYDVFHGFTKSLCSKRTGHRTRTEENKRTIQLRFYNGDHYSPIRGTLTRQPV